MWMAPFVGFHRRISWEKRTTGKRFRSGQAVGVSEFAPPSDDRMHLAAGILLDRLRRRSAGRAADGLLHPGHGNEAWSKCTKQIARQVLFCYNPTFASPLYRKAGLEARRHWGYLS